MLADCKKRLIFASAFSEATSIGAVVQLVRMPACHAGGRGFESLPHRLRMPLSYLRGIFSIRSFLHLSYIFKNGPTASL